MSRVMVAKVQMPEKGVFFVRVDEAAVASGAVSRDTRGRVVVALDYGEDVGELIAMEPYDSAVHGERIPGFRLVRRFASPDERILAENKARADDMRGVFIDLARADVPDLRIPSARLSFGRKRLFMRYVCEKSHPNFSVAQAELKRRFGVECNLWPMGLRDEVAETGWIGPCGRMCCCCCWQKRFPSHLAPEHRNKLPALMNGICGRFKCCLAFERDSNCV